MAPDKTSQRLCIYLKKKQCIYLSFQLNMVCYHIPLLQTDVIVTQRKSKLLRVSQVRCTNARARVVLNGSLPRGSWNTENESRGIQRGMHQLHKIRSQDY